MSPRFLPLRESGYTDDHHHFRICLPCAELYEVERPDGMSQACTCRRDPDADRWPGYDLNRHAELCECCRGAVMRGGSRFAPWFCPECLKRVRAFNSALGAPLIPVGRHSMTNGIGIRADADRPQIEAGVENMKGLFGRMDVLHAYAEGVLRRLLHELGCPPDVRLSFYLRDLAYRRLDDPTVSRAAMFDDLVDHFAARLGIASEAMDEARTAAHRT